MNFILHVFLATPTQESLAQPQSGIITSMTTDRVREHMCLLKKEIAKLSNILKKELASKLFWNVIQININSTQ